jgi:hypothetical protein
MRFHKKCTENLPSLRLSDFWFRWSLLLQAVAMTELGFPECCDGFCTELNQNNFVHLVEQSGNSFAKLPNKKT